MPLRNGRPYYWGVGPVFKNHILFKCKECGSTAVACININRNFIGIELDDKYFEIAKQRTDTLIGGGSFKCGAAFIY